jgi:hypothetical protein
MEADEDGRPPRSDDVGSRLQQRVQLIELLIDRYAQCLKRAGGRIDATHAMWAHGSHYGTPQIERGLELTALESLRDAASHATGAPLLSQLVDQPSQLVLVEPFNELKRRIAS